MNQNTIREVLRFGMVGVLNTLVGYGSYWLALRFGAHYLLALVVSHIVGVTHSYFWNKFWTFQRKAQNRTEFVRFILVYGVTFGINLFGLTVAVEQAHISPQYGQVFALGVATMVSFVGHRFWTFRPPAASQPGTRREL